MTRNAVIRAIAARLPEGRLTNDMLDARWQNWSADKIRVKTGIQERRIAAEDEYASDLASAALEKLFAAGHCRPDQIDILLFCSQSPDYLLPATACLIQDRLGLPTRCMAFDVNQGCSGYVYGLAVVKSLLEAGMGERAILLTADTYSKYIHPEDRSVATLFGDAGTATLLDAVRSNSGGSPFFGPFVFGTDGSGASYLTLESGGCRQRRARAAPPPPNYGRYPDCLYMNGPEIFAFTMNVVPPLVTETLEKAELQLEDVDLFIFHQANLFIMEALRKKLGIPKERFVIEIEDVGNTVSCTIPIALERCLAAGSLRPGMRVMLVGFGVGLSWGATVLTWDANIL